MTTQVDQDTPTDVDIEALNIQASDNGALPDPDLTDNAREVLKRRYLKKDAPDNPIETPKDMFWRVARVIASEDHKYGATEEEVTNRARQFYKMMSQGYWEPNSPTLMNAGRPLGQLSACFVLPISDTMSNGKDGIYDTLRNMALIHQSGGGTGFSFSRLRPSGSIVKSTTGVASGPVSFMTLYDASTNVVKQGGTRRGANMGILRVDHPDIKEFINCKQDTSQITNFNISVAVTDEFMRAVRDGDSYDLRDPRAHVETDETLDAREVFDEVVEQAWATGEPGLFFIDEANRDNPVPQLGSYEATNPCGEQCLLPYDVCNLGSLNLAKFAKHDIEAIDDLDGALDWDRMREYIHLGVRFLDNVIDANRYPLDRIEDLAHRIRRIGHGVMGWADMLIKLGVPYDSDLALEVADRVARFFKEESHRASQKLAEERGVFPEWSNSVWGPDETCARNEDGERIKPERRLRNCNITTVAPTGTISIIAGCSGGIEPLFAVGFMRNQAGTTMPDVHREFSGYVLPDAPEDWRQTLIDSGGLDHDWVHPKARRLFCTANEIAPEQHVRMQAVWQAHIDNSLSKTINFDRDATVDDVREAYMLANELGCKGITVYRDGSRPGQVLSTGKTNAKEDEPVKPDKRPTVLQGETRKVETPIGQMYVTVNSYGEDPYEVFVTVGKAGGAAMADAEAIGRLISLALQNGVGLEDVYKQLIGISSEQVIGFGENKVRSGPDGIAQALAQYLGDHPEVNTQKSTIGSCPECSAPLAFSEGCESCQSCGYSKCS